MGASWGRHRADAVNDLIKRIVAVGVPSAAAAILGPLYLTNEGGMVLEAYKDPLGVWTQCAGSTANVEPGSRKTPEECIEIVAKDVEKHNAAMIKCQPRPMPPHVYAAVLDFTLNVGVGNFCKSTLRQKLYDGDWSAACAQFPRWVMGDGGRVDCRIRANNCTGVVVRRYREQAVCNGAGLANLGAIG